MLWLSAYDTAQKSPTSLPTHGNYVLTRSPSQLSFCAAIVYYVTYVVDLALYATLFYSYFQVFGFLSLSTMTHMCMSHFSTPTFRFLASFYSRQTRRDRWLGRKAQRRHRQGDTTDRTDRRVRQTDRTFRQTDRQTNRTDRTERTDTEQNRLNSRIDRTDKLTHRQTERQTDRKTGRPTERD